MSPKPAAAQPTQHVEVQNPEPVPIETVSDVIRADMAPPWDEEPEDKQAPAKPAAAVKALHEMHSGVPSANSATANAASAAVAIDPAPADPKPQINNATPEVPAKSSNASTADELDITGMELGPQSWPIMFPALPLDGMLRNLVANTCLVTVEGMNLTFHSDAGHMRLFGEQHQKRFEHILSEALGQPYKLSVLEGAITYETPAQRAQRLQAERLAQAVAAIENDTNVQALRQAFGAQVIIDSIKPIDVG